MSVRAVGIVLVVFSIVALLAFFLLPVIYVGGGTMLMEFRGDMILWTPGPDRTATPLSLLYWSVPAMAIIGGIIGALAAYENGIKRAAGLVVMVLSTVVGVTLLYHLTELNKVASRDVGSGFGFGGILVAISAAVTLASGFWIGRQAVDE